DEIDEAPGATADVKEFELPLVAPGEDLVQWNERLATDRVGRAVEQHLDLDVVALRGVLGQPAARLEMKVLQIIGGPPAADIVGEHRAHLTRLAAAMNIGEIVEEQPRPVQELEQRAVVIRGARR